MNLTNRWVALGVLFLARVAMGFQFQSVPALTPLFVDAYDIDLTQLGLLIAVYLSPGVVIAFPGGTIGARIGDKRAVAIGLVLMVAGGALMAASTGWNLQLAGRFLAGVGAITLNVLMSKLVTDYFAGREIATAMGIFVNSWPVGIAAALVVLPSIGLSSGLSGAMTAVLVACIAALLLFVIAFRPAAGAAAQAMSGAMPSGRVFRGIVAAGLVWGLYNAAIGMVFGFGPAMLSERGWDLETSAGVTSIFLWVACLSIPFGGLIADRLHKRDAVLMVSCLVFAVMLSIAAQVSAVVPVFAVMGAIGGLAAGPIMSLPAAILSPEQRAKGMGIFYTLFYFCTASAPFLAGALSDWVGTSRAAFHFGAVQLLVAILLAWRIRVAFAQRS
ncbi:MAG: arabinose ABC transporter permease [Rhodobacteraceae bacterium]|nr:arabinose ABC transporter permease [Paracoccaceae bacterium]